MAILIPSKNIFGMQYSPVANNKITGISINALSVVNNKSWQEYTTYPFANSLNVDTDGEWGMSVPPENADENSEYFWSDYNGVSSAIYKAWQSVPFEITAKKHFTDITEENLFGNIRFSVSQSRAAGELKNGSWTKDEGLSGTIVSDFTYRDRYASGFTMFSLAVRTVSSVWRILFSATRYSLSSGQYSLRCRRRLSRISEGRRWIDEVPNTKST